MWVRFPPQAVLRRAVRTLAARVLGPLLLLGLLGTARPAHAVDVSLGIGAQYWLAERGLFDFDAIIRQRLGRGFSVGGRVGVVIAATPVDIGIPLDLTLRFDVERIYFELLGGAWIFIDGKHVAPHVAGGVGVVAGNLTFGPEIGWLDPRAVFGARLTYRL